VSGILAIEMTRGHVQAHLTPAFWPTSAWTAKVGQRRPINAVMIGYEEEEEHNDVNGTSAGNALRRAR